MNIKGYFKKIQNKSNNKKSKSARNEKYVFNSPNLLKQDKKLKTFHDKKQP